MLIDQRIQELNDWRGATLQKVRQVILQSDPEIIEEWKWEIPVWSREGIICTGETYKKVVKLTFAKGASLPDPAGLFNSSLEGKVRRAIDIREGEAVNESALKALIQAAIAFNRAGKESSARAKPALLKGGNPRIAKADGEAPVQAYIESMPGWKRDVGRKLDALIAKAAPGVRKAVKWNSPFYGMEGKGWFLALHVFTNYVKVTFFHGATLQPLPPGESKTENARHLDIRENDKLDETQFTEWVRQASQQPGWGKS
jgi:hypothetical protein